MATEILDTFYAVATEIAGADAVARVMEAKGGCEVSIPNRIDGTHWLSGVFGEDVAQKIVKRMRTFDADGRFVAGPLFYIPLGQHAIMRKKRSEIDALLRSGLAVDAVARRTGITSRMVKRRLALLKCNGERIESAAGAPPAAPSEVRVAAGEAGRGRGEAVP